MAFEDILVAIEEPVGIITFNRTDGAERIARRSSCSEFSDALSEMAS